MLLTLKYKAFKCLICQPRCTVNWFRRTIIIIVKITVRCRSMTNRTFMHNAHDDTFDGSPSVARYRYYMSEKCIHIDGLCMFVHCIFNIKHWKHYYKSHSQRICAMENLKWKTKNYFHFVNCWMLNDNDHRISLSLMAFNDLLNTCNVDGVAKIQAKKCIS